MKPSATALLGCQICHSLRLRTTPRGQAPLDFVVRLPSIAAPSINPRSTRCANTFESWRTGRMKLRARMYLRYQSNFGSIDGGLSPDRCRARWVLLTAESGDTWTSRQRESWSLESASSLDLDPQLLDDRPPLLGFGLLQCAERLRCLSFARGNIVSEIGDPGSRRRIANRSPPH
jgi:hypothetical protein